MNLKFSSTEVETLRKEMSEIDDKIKKKFQ